MNSNYELTNLNGNISITNNVGKIRVQPGIRLSHLSIKAEHSELELFVQNPDLFNYDLFAKNSKILLGTPGSNWPFQQKSENRIFYNSDPKRPMIEVSTSFNNIKLN